MEEPENPSHLTPSHPFSPLWPSHLYISLYTPHWSDYIAKLIYFSKQYFSTRPSPSKMNVKSYSYPSISSAPSFDEFLGCDQAVVPNTPIQCLREPSSPPKLKRRGAWLGYSSFAPIEEDEDLARNDDLLLPSLDKFTTTRIHAVLPFRLQAKRKRSSYTDETSGPGDDQTSTMNKKRFISTSTNARFVSPWTPHCPWK